MVDMIPIQPRLVRMLILVLSAWVFATAAPHILSAFPWARGGAHPLEIPISTDYNGRFRQAWGNAGTRFLPGDVVAWERMKPALRYTITPARPPVILSAPVDVPLSNRPVTIRLTGEPYPYQPSDLILRGIGSVALIAAIGFVTFRRPTRLHVDLFLFAVGANPIALNARLTRFPSWEIWVVCVSIVDALAAVAFIAATDFAITFAAPRVPQLRALWERALPIVTALFVALELWPDFGTIALGQHLESMNRAGFVMQGALVVVGAAALAAAARYGSRRDAVAVVVFVLGVGGSFTASLLLYSSFFKPVSDTMNDLLESLSLAMFFFVVNGTVLWDAIRRHGKVKRITLHLLSQSLSATLAELGQHAVQAKEPNPGTHGQSVSVLVLTGISALLGITIEQVTDRATSRLIDGERHRAFRTLDTNAAGLASFTSRDQIVTTMIVAPTNALHLTGAAVCRRAATGEYRTEASTAGLAFTIPADTVALETIAASPNGVLLVGPETAGLPNSVFAHGMGFPGTGIPPDIIVLYGPHEWGEELDAEESRYLASFVRSAIHFYHRAT